MIVITGERGPDESPDQGRNGRARRAPCGTAMGPRVRPAYPGRVLSPRQVVDYALQRRALLADVRAGRVGREEVCDAGAYLLRAARFHGAPADRACPVCRHDELAQVSWVFGESLRHVSGSACSAADLEQLAAQVADFSVHVVEVCTECRWNHLVRSFVLGTGRPRRGRRSAGG